ncbi:MAG: amidase [Aquincola sp.]|nr:amidase [Aquincola sp.]
MSVVAELCDWPATRLAQAIGRREVSCREVMVAYLAQIERLNPQANAIVSLQPAEQLLAEADARDAQLARGEPMGWLHGMPQAPKDLADVAGIRSTHGSLILQHHVPTQDAIVVERMRRAGAIFIGKTNTPEMGLGSHTYNRVFGTTRNAFDPRLSAGGSSGGAAVALALRMLPVADGSDMMGSLRNPAGWNNVFGLRPSFGRVPRGPAAPEQFLQQLGTEGPMGRTVADVAQLLAVQAGWDARSPLSLDTDVTPFSQPLDRDWRGARIGWLADYGGHLATEPGVLETCAQALKHFEAIGCHVEPVAPFFDMERLWRTWLTLRGALVAHAQGAWHADPTKRALMKPEAVWEVENGLRLTAAEVMHASADRTAWYHALREQFERFDFLLLPSAQVFPFDATLDWPHEINGRAMDTYHRWMEMVIGGTLAGLPVLGMPAGFGPQGQPIGLQLMGPPRADLAVLQMGHAYEQASGCSGVRSPLLR